jgi:hypothetical protein
MLSFSNIVYTIYNPYNNNRNLFDKNLYNVNKNLIKLIIIKDKKIPKLINKVSNKLNTSYKNNYDKISSVMYKYNELSEEDKFIVETVIDLLIY